MQRFEHTYAIEIRDGIMFVFYLGLPHIHVQTLFSSMLKLRTYTAREYHFFTFSRSFPSMINSQSDYLVFSSASCWFNYRGRWVITKFGCSAFVVFKGLGE